MTGDVDEVKEGSFHVILVGLDVGTDDDAFATAFEPEDSALHEAEEHTPVTLLKSGIGDGDVEAFGRWALLVYEDLNEDELDEGGERVDDDGFDVGIVSCFGEEFRAAFEEFHSRSGFAFGICEWCVVEPRLGEAVASVKKLHWAVEVPVTVEDEGLGELQGNGGFACAWGADEEEGLGKRGEEVGGGFHLMELVVKLGEQEVEAAKGLGWVEGEERADLGEFVFQGKIEFSKDLLFLAGGVVGC